MSFPEREVSPSVFSPRNHSAASLLSGERRTRSSIRFNTARCGARRLCSTTYCWLRPFRDLVYAMPPYVTGDEDVARICAGIERAVSVA